MPPAASPKIAGNSGTDGEEVVVVAAATEVAFLFEVIDERLLVLRLLGLGSGCRSC